MFGLRLRARGWFVLLFAVAFFAGAGSIAAQPPNAKEATEKAAEIKDLLRKRCDVLNKVVKVFTNMYLNGRIDITPVLTAEREAMKAALDCHELPEERLVLLREHQKVVEKLQQIVEARFNAGQDSSVAADQARVLVMEARIELLREDLKAKPGKK